jgi:nudix-type nucleoside diphosphatase (YffH/AdpP family)
MTELVSTHIVHQGWATFSVVSIRLSGGDVIRREVEDHGRAVAVLPYDPVRRVAMLVEQLRVPMFVTEGMVVSREAPAGILEGIDPTDCARREAFEECGLALAELEHLGQVWTMPGVSTERMELFLGSYCEADRVAAGGGLPEEHEEITVVEVLLSDLAKQADAGGIVDMKTFALVQSLRLRRPELFA